MARIRTIKPEFWDDELIASLSRDARLLFIGTWNFADDKGRLRWSPAYLKSKVFPYDEDLEIKGVAALMAELEQKGRVLTYTVDAGTITQTYAVIVNFPRHQRINRAQESSLPPPPPLTPPPTGGETPFTEHSVNGHGAGGAPSGSTQPPVSEPSLGEGKGRERKGKEEERPALSRGSGATTKLAQDITKAYTDEVPLSRFPAILQIVRKALLAEIYEPELIKAALLRLAADNRSVTIEALRVELEGLPRSRQLRAVDEQDPAVTGKRRVQL